MMLFFFLFLHYIFWVLVPVEEGKRRRHISKLIDVEHTESCLKGMSRTLNLSCSDMHSCSDWRFMVMKTLRQTRIKNCLIGKGSEVRITRLEKRLE